MATVGVKGLTERRKEQRGVWRLQQAPDIFDEKPPFVLNNENQNRFYNS